MQHQSEAMTCAISVRLAAWGVNVLISSPRELVKGLCQNRKISGKAQILKRFDEVCERQVRKPRVPIQRCFDTGDDWCPRIC